MEYTNFSAKRIFSLANSHSYGATFLEIFIICAKGDATKVILDARHLTSNSVYYFEYWPIEPSVSKQAPEKNTILFVIFGTQVIK